MQKFLFFPGLFFLLFTATANAQPDSIVAIKDTSRQNIKKDSLPAISKKDSVKKKHNPRVATLRSAILPGWGQIYNKKYWKLPIVYGALGTSAGIFVYNLQWYRRTRFAYKVLVENDTPNFPNVHSKLQFFLAQNDQESLQYIRNQFRRDIDYSVLFFLLLWGLNVVDATVDAHLKSFDVSPDLSLSIRPGYSEMAGTNGISLVLNFKTNRTK
jgi:hypothetical protein